MAEASHEDAVAMLLQARGLAVADVDAWLSSTSPTSPTSPATPLRDLDRAGFVRHVAAEIEASCAWVLDAPASEPSGGPRTATTTTSTPNKTSATAGRGAGPATATAPHARTPQPKARSQKRIRPTKAVPRATPNAAFRGNLSDDSQFPVLGSRPPRTTTTTTTATAAASRSRAPFGGGGPPQAAGSAQAAGGGRVDLKALMLDTKPDLTGSGRVLDTVTTAPITSSGGSTGPGRTQQRQQQLQQRQAAESGVLAGTGTGPPTVPTARSEVAVTSGLYSLFIRHRFLYVTKGLHFLVRVLTVRPGATHPDAGHATPGGAPVGLRAVLASLEACAAFAALALEGLADRLGNLGPVVLGLLADNQRLERLAPALHARLQAERKGAGPRPEAGLAVLRAARARTAALEQPPPPCGPAAEQQPAASSTDTLTFAGAPSDFEKQVANCRDRIRFWLRDWRRQKQKQAQLRSKFERDIKEGKYAAFAKAFVQALVSPEGPASEEAVVTRLRSTDSPRFHSLEARFFERRSSRQTLHRTDRDLFFRELMEALDSAALSILIHECLLVEICALERLQGNHDGTTTLVRLHACGSFLGFLVFRPLEATSRGTTMLAAHGLVANSILGTLDVERRLQRAWDGRCLAIVAPWVCALLCEAPALVVATTAMASIAQLLHRIRREYFLRPEHPGCFLVLAVVEHTLVLLEARQQPPAQPWASVPENGDNATPLARAPTDRALKDTVDGLIAIEPRILNLCSPLVDDVRCTLLELSPRDARPQPHTRLSVMTLKKAAGGEAVHSDDIGNVTEYIAKLAAFNALHHILSVLVPRELANARSLLVTWAKSCGPDEAQLRLRRKETLRDMQRRIYALSQSHIDSACYDVAYQATMTLAPRAASLSKMQAHSTRALSDWAQLSGNQSADKARKWVEKHLEAKVELEANSALDAGAILLSLAARTAVDPALTRLRRSNSIPGNMNVAWLGDAVEALRALTAPPAAGGNAAGHWAALAASLPREDGGTYLRDGDVAAIQQSLQLLRNATLDVLSADGSVWGVAPCSAPLVSLCRALRALLANQDAIFLEFWRQMLDPRRLYKSLLNGSAGAPWLGARLQELFFEVVRQGLLPAGEVENWWLSMLESLQWPLEHLDALLRCALTLPELVGAQTQEGEGQEEAGKEGGVVHRLSFTRLLGAVRRRAPSAATRRLAEGLMARLSAGFVVVLGAQPPLS